MAIEVGSIIQGAITSLLGLGAGIYAAKSKKTTDSMAVLSSRDEVVLVHYDKIVDQLQEEVGRLIKENTSLSEAKLRLEKAVLDLNKQVLDLSRQVEELKYLLKGLGKQ